MHKKKPLVFPEETVNWNELEAIGIYKDDLEKKGELESLLNGEKTGSINLHLMLNGINIDLDATLQLIPQDDLYIVEVRGISPE
ncbi:DUF4099 domain-containing protein [Dysgonomonas termitidis]|uniref:DUF4099 domain-containing protein n=1 Tax=Dysgonomonas termitidis TaxID=1516126 RepID=A0ABV9L236_9BACT